MSARKTEDETRLRKGKAERAARLEEALRDNLKRRKEQARVRSGQSPREEDPDARSRTTIGREIGHGKAKD